MPTSALPGRSVSILSKVGRHRSLVGLMLTVWCCGNTGMGPQGIILWRKLEILCLNSVMLPGHPDEKQQMH